MSSRDGDRYIILGRPRRNQQPLHRLPLPPGAAPGADEKITKKLGWFGYFLQKGVPRKRKSREDSLKTTRMDEAREGGYGWLRRAAPRAARDGTEAPAARGGTEAAEPMGPKRYAYVASLPVAEGGEGTLWHYRFNPYVTAYSCVLIWGFVIYTISERWQAYKEFQTWSQWARGPRLLDRHARREPRPRGPPRPRRGSSAETTRTYEGDRLAGTPTRRAACRRSASPWP